MQDLPRVRIKHGWLLESGTRELHRLQRFKGKPPYPSYSLLRRRVSGYRRAWAKHGDHLMGAMCTRLGLRFRQVEIDMYIVRWIIPQSDPLIINIQRTPSHFLDLACHELLHRLLTENTAGLEPMRIWKKMLPNEQFSVQTHVLVHATLQYLYEEVWRQPSRTKRDVRESKTYRDPGYGQSWDIVLERGYNEVIEDFKKRAGLR